MSIGLLVSDVDGTLVDKAKQLTPVTIAAVARLRDAGVAFTIISARPMSGMRAIADTLSIDLAMAAFNGGIVFRRDGRIVSRATIEPDVARGVLALSDGQPVDRWVFADDRWHANAGEGMHAEHERIASAQEPIITSDFAPLLDHADKITLVSDDPALLAALASEATARFGTRATIGQSQTYYLDVTARSANKGDGITALARAAGIPLESTAAIGDQFNDLAMLTKAGLSIAMGSAPDGVRKAVQHVTLANDADGVAHAIDTLIAPRL